VGGQSVHDLSIRSSHLSNEHLPALLSLTKLRRLDIALNKKITTIDRLLDALPALQTLDASYDSVSSLGQAGYGYRCEMHNLILICETFVQFVNILK